MLWGLELVDRVPKAGPPCAGMGVGTGPVILQRGDYFGWTVNVAARITDHARAWQVLVIDAVVTAADSMSAIRFLPMGPVSLNGLVTPISQYAASRASGDLDSL